MAAQMTCQASLTQFGLKKAASKPTYSVPGGPLGQGWSKQTANFAVSSGAMEVNPRWNSANTQFVRPDVDQPVEESWSAFNRNTSKSSASPSRPQFRSALEQVSFETNENLMERFSGVKPKNGNLFGLAARIFGK